MTRMVQVALAEDVTEAEEIQAILEAAGITSELETAVEHHPRATEDAPQKVLVAECTLEAAQYAIEAMTDPDELVSRRLARDESRAPRLGRAPRWSRPGLRMPRPRRTRPATSTRRSAPASTRR